MTPGGPPAGGYPGFVPFADLPRAHGSPELTARLRTTPEDFRVDELLGYGLDGAGDHVWLRIEKRGANTEWVARSVADLAGVGQVDVGFAGLKDRHAVTVQWFSVNLAGVAEPDWTALESPEVTLRETVRHRRKLRRGGHRGNRFRLVLRDVAGDRSGLDDLAARIGRAGVPNYFGPQRFGRGAGNVGQAWEMLARGRRIRDRHRRGIYLSTARAVLFNRVLATRVAGGTWDQVVAGDLLVRDRGRGTFSGVEGEAETAARVARAEVHPTGPLWGRSGRRAAGDALAVEEQVLAGCEAWRRGLERAGLAAERRALRLRPEELEVGRGPGDSLSVAFSLPRGAYATTVMREIVSVVEGGSA